MSSPLPTPLPASQSDESAYSPSALALGSLAALAWGLTGAFIKLLPEFTTLEVLAIRMTVSLMVTLIIFAVRPKLLTAALRLIRRPIGRVLSSLMVFYYLFAVRAFQLSPVGDVALIVGLSPMIGLLVKGLSGQPLKRAEASGGAIAFIGLILFVWPKLQGRSGDQSTYFTGLFFALLAACVSLSYATLFKEYSAQQQALRQVQLASANDATAEQKTAEPVVGPVVVSCTAFVIGSILITPVALVSSPDLIVRVFANGETLAIALGLGLISTVVPTFCYSYAAQHLSPILTTALNLLTPVSAAAIAFILLQETVPLLSLLGAALIFAGIFLLATAKPKRLAA